MSITTLSFNNLNFSVMVKDSSLASHPRAASAKKQEELLQFPFLLPTAGPLVMMTPPK